jgi:osmotically-inducible protein OsmY
MEVDKVQKTGGYKWWKSRKRKPKPGSPGYIRERIQSHIISEPAIEDSSKIAVNIKKGGLFSKDEIHLIGEVSSRKDKERVEKVARENGGKEMELVNWIVVEE